MSRVITAATMLAVGIIALAAAPAAHAETQVNATGACKSALPVFDGNIRSRPLGVRNEGTSNAFISCSVPSEHGTRLALVGLRVHNGNAVATSLSCTFVNGRFNFAPQSETQTIELPANTSDWMIFYPGATAPDGGDLANFSCNLKPGTELSYIATQPAS
ncbi:hypothetical protein [Luteimonas arsenica]|uniref:hypothetical protein n=1 Tax=Luteimonas arsenica TaxID=1586242 RepID=UPI001054CC61|nr:hypothetical protein [Luteimonas arsenica]